MQVSITGQCQYLMLHALELYSSSRPEKQMSWKIDRSSMSLKGFLGGGAISALSLLCAMYFSLPTRVPCGSPPTNAKKSEHSPLNLTFIPLKSNLLYINNVKSHYNGINSKCGPHNFCSPYKNLGNFWKYILLNLELL